MIIMDTTSEELSDDNIGEMAADSGNLLHRRQAIRRRGFNFQLDQSVSGTLPVGGMASRVERRRPKSVPALPTNPNGPFQSRSSVDLTPSLLSMYDHLNTATNGSQSENSHRNTGNSLHGNGHTDNNNETNVKLLAQEEVRSQDMEDNVDSSRVLSVGQKRPLSIGSTSSSSSTSLPTYASHKRPNLGECEKTNNHCNKPTLLSLANSGNTSMDSLTIGEDWTTLSAQHADPSDPYYETIKVSANDPPVVRVYSPQNSTGSADENSLNSSSDANGDNSPQHMQSTYSLKLSSNNNSTASFSSSDSVTKLSDKNSLQSPVLSKDAKCYVSYAQRVASEIVETEKSYVHSLGEIIEGYMKHIRHCDRISEAEANQLFGNLEDIYTFNKNLLAELDECSEDPVEVARCFVENNEGFDIYTQYCTDYPDSMEVLTNCMMQPSLAEKFKSWQAALGHGLPLGAYLLKPVQRILKYHLLLQNIVKHYESDRHGYDTLTTALEQMTHLAHHINEMKRRHEHAVRVQEVQSQMEGYEGPDLSTLGELKLEGCFRLLGAKASRSVFLFEKGIIITKRKEDGMFLCKTVIVCSNLMLVESIAKEPLSFHVIPFDNTKLQYTLQARNLDMKRKWCQEIKRLILESYMGKIPDKVKNLLMGLGKTREEVEEELRNHSYHLGVDDKKPRRKSANLMDLVKMKKAHRKNESTPPKLAPMEPSEQAYIRNSSSRLQVKQSNKSMSGSRSMDNLSLSGNHTLPRTKLSSNSDQSPSLASQNGHVDPNLATHFTFVESSFDPNQNGQVSRAKSFKIATRAHPLTSISLSDHEESSDSESTDDDNHRHQSINDDDVYVRLMCNNNMDTNGDHGGMSYGSRGVSMPALNADIDEPDYVTVMMKPPDGESVSSNSQSSAVDNDRTSGAFDSVTAEDMIADNNLIYQTVDFPKSKLLSKSNSSSYDNLHKRWSNTSSNPEAEGHVSPVLPPPSQFADNQRQEALSAKDNCAPSADVATSNPWVKQTPENEDTKGDKSDKSTAGKRSNLLGKSYSFPLGDGDVGRHASQESFDWLVYSNKLASDLSEKFCKLKMWDKFNKAKLSSQPKYPGYVPDKTKDDTFSLQQKKTIVRYGTPPRSALTVEKVNQFNSKQKKDGSFSKKSKPKSNKDNAKNRVSLSTAQLWGNKMTGLVKYNKPDKTKDKSRKAAYPSDSKKMLEEMENYAENNSSVHSSSSSLNKFPSTSTLTSQKSSEEKFRLPTEFPQNKSNDSWSMTSRESVYSGNFMSKSRDSLSSSTSSLNKVGSVPKVANGVQDGSQDGFVGSLRTKLSHLTARLTARKQTPNINSTFNPPTQGQFTAAYNTRYKTQSPVKQEGFVSHLARIYNSRDQTSPQRSSPKRVTTTPERITNYASVLRNRQLGGSALGSRLATSTTTLQPKVRSLPRQLTAPTCGASDTETCSETNSVHSLDYSKDKSPDRNSNIAFVSNSIEQSDSALSIRSNVSSVDASLSHSSKRRSSCDSVNSVGSVDSIYERRFSRNLEEAEDNVFRDSAVYSDMDTGYFFTAPKSLPATPRKSIKEVVQQIEERSRPKLPEVIDVRKREPGRTIQEKLKSLQESSQYHHRSHTIDDEVEGGRPLKEFRRSLGSSRSSVDRDEASYSIRYNRGFTGHEDGVKMSRSTGRLDQIDNEVSTLMTMKGWVRQLINKFQTDQ